VLDRCLTEEPGLRPVSQDALHSSACWLPVQAAGLSEQAEKLRAETVREGRGKAAAEVFEAEVAQAQGSEGSVAG
jgi:hypothetical protein